MEASHNMRPEVEEVGALTIPFLQMKVWTVQELHSQEEVLQ